VADARGGHAKPLAEGIGWHNPIIQALAERLASRSDKTSCVG
jgi:hypothetical protein